MSHSTAQVDYVITNCPCRLESRFFLKDPPLNDVDETIRHHLA